MLLHRHSGGEKSVDIAIPAVLSAAVWNVLPLLSPRAAQSLSITAPALHSLLTPASERAKLTGQIARQLRTLPFDFDFPLPVMSPKVLQETLRALRPMRPLRRRDLVGRDAGYAPTDSETWCFRSEAELMAVVKAGDLARQGTRKQMSKSGPLLFGTTLRLDGAQTLEGPLWTSSVGLEWAYGPTADPLQLGLRLGLHADGRAEIDLDIGSGGWSPWEEHWTLREGTLTASMVVVAALPTGETATIRTEIVRETGHFEVGEECQSNAWACEIQNLPALRQAFVSAGDEGIRAVTSIGSIRWEKDPPEWCPEEVQELVLNPVQEWRPSAGIFF